MFGYINKLIEKLKKDEKGQGMVEYALIIAFVVAIAVYLTSGDNGLGKAISGTFDSAANTLKK